MTGMFEMKSPYGYMLITPFKFRVKNGTRLEFCHVLRDLYVVKPVTGPKEPESNMRIEVPVHWLKEIP